MKTKLLLIALLAVSIMVYAKPKAERVTAVFHVEISCDNCVKRIQDNIAFEKGLKDMRINKEQQTVTLTWDPAKTDTVQLKTAFAKITKPVGKIEIVREQ